MLKHKNSKGRTLFLLFLDALAPVLGALIALNLHLPPVYLGLILAFFAGFFLYLSTSDLLPEAHRNNHSYAILGSTVLGTVIVFIITRFL
jgi:ZIP family zinc transporter